MLANAHAYLLETERAGREFAETVELAARLGQQRPHVIILMGCDTRLDLGDADGALTDIETALDIIECTGIQRFEPWCLVFKARILDARGQCGEALALAKRAVEICRDTGVTFLSPMALGSYALLCREEDERRAAFEEAEALLAPGCVSHDYLYFFRDAMEASLAAGEWDEAERFAAALEDYAREEPMPWSDYYIAWGCALAAWGRGMEAPRGRSAPPVGTGPEGAPRHGRARS
mgnify:CR=1 FL=1